MANPSATRSLDALAAPPRRAIIDSLGQAPSAVGELARAMPVSRAAVSQHLRVLKEAGLVQERAAGTRRIYRIDPRGLAAMRAWLDEHWAAAMASFARDCATEENEPGP